MKLTSSFSINPVSFILSVTGMKDVLSAHACSMIAGSYAISVLLTTDVGITLMDIVYIFFQQVRKIIYTDQSSGYLLLICLSKALMTLIQHTETTACTFTQPPHMLTQPVLSSFWLYYVMEHVLCLHMDPNNLISR